MKKIHEFLSRPVVTVLLFALAIGLLAGSGVGGARAALNIQSEIYESTVVLPTIGVQLLEKKGDKFTPVEGDLLEALLGEDKVLKPGKIYKEGLAVRNTGTIDEFVRVTVQKYWLDAKGNKTPAMDSDWIQLGFVTGGGWVIDDAATTEERTVLYYTSALPVGEDSTPLMESITLDGKVAKMVTQTRDPAEGYPATITTTFNYDGYKLCLEATVDSVQTHNGQAAVKSAWGRNVTVSGNTLSLG